MMVHNDDTGGEVSPSGGGGGYGGNAGAYGGGSGGGFESGGRGGGGYGGGGGGYGGGGADRRGGSGGGGYNRRDHDSGGGRSGSRDGFGGGGCGNRGGDRGAGVEYGGSDYGSSRSGGGGVSHGGSQEHDMPDTIFITGMPEEVTEGQIEEHFGAIGIIKLDKKTRRKKIWIYKDKESGRGKGEATVTYDDPPTAESAISWFDGKEFMGNTIKVQVAQRKSTWVPPQRGGRGRGGCGG
ncbi:RNA binding protein-like, partial [Tropilaelaps mercedesae]